eukprot:CAMPEP_0182572560 /NCGR_PEP_ID=MMETSP1324-20130603/17414_1 /TAXON_ID=236786 /ORGANISM="Florenciella sp., Strain RCC1587" /LENGTH=34 /DNA_ID= /DNA_START= /DNA_END= /DNA_ORIENTATION=
MATGITCDLQPSICNCQPATCNLRPETTYGMRRV